jgi:hypothetical protein
MKKAVVFVFGALMLVATACGGEDKKESGDKKEGETSKKGAWSKADIEKFDAEMEKIGSSLDAMGDQKEAFIDCYFEKIQANYDSFAEANTDGPGASKYAEECAAEVMANMMPEEPEMDDSTSVEEAPVAPEAGK